GPEFASTVGLRKEPRTGFSFAVFGGANLFESLSGTLDSQAIVPPGILTTVGTKASADSTIEPVGGLKLRYDWPFDPEPIEQFSDELQGRPLHLGAALEAEAFYLGGKISANTSTQGVSTSLNSAVFMLNPLLTLQTGKWRPYIGPGVGFAYIDATGYNNPATTQTSATQTALAIQGEAGVDYFFVQDWSIFAEYKYLVFNNFNLFDSPAKIDASRLDNHILTMGLRKTF
ncbi:MAG: outer membrane beta-barrel protein, partial [Methylacidiphilales bacterium]|nr:outer membrane beta-barrel protein [Candidatus Methylacidiphilales bacterium]